VLVAVREGDKMADHKEHSATWLMAAETSPGWQVGAPAT
jgi:hypothetical protein